MKGTTTGTNSYPEEIETKTKRRDKTVKIIPWKETPAAGMDLKLSRYRKTGVKKRVVAHVSKSDQ